MDLKTYLDQPERRGRQSQLALQIKAQSQLVSQWSNKVRPIPDDRCPAIEQATAGAVSCEEMRPDLHWRRIKDKTWPWNGGRPLLDLTVEA